MAQARRRYAFSIPSLQSTHPSLRTITNIPELQHSYELGADIDPFAIKGAKSAKAQLELLRASGNMHVSESVVESAENRVVLLQNIHASTETQAGDLMTAISGLATSIKSLSDTVDARFDDMDKRFETMDKRFETMEATTEETFGKVEARLRDFEDIVQERLDKMDAKADNFLKRFYNIHSLIPTGKLTYMLHKTVPGCGYERARNLLPDSRIGSYLTHMAPLDQEPALGAVINLDISLFDAWNHGDILQCMTFYNEDFKIIAADTLVERKAKLRAWLTVG